MRLFATILILTCTAWNLQAFEWPVEDRVLTSTFGEYRWGGFHPGIDIGGEQDVFAAEVGELIYFEDNSCDAGMLPSGLGNFAVLEHERGLRTLYGHLSPGSLLAAETSFDAGDMLAKAGSSGIAVGPRLHFQVIDREFDQFVNPLLLLPPLRDKTKPVLEALYILKNRELMKLENRMTIPAGSYELLLSLYDPSEYVRYFRPMNPYRVQVFMNGQQVGYISFNALQPKDGAVFLIESDNAESDDVYYENGAMNLGTLQFSPGDIMLEVLAEDIARNGITKEIRIRAVE